MGETHRVEINKDGETGSFSEVDVSNLEKEAAELDQRQQEALQEEQQREQQFDPSRPEWLPEKFETAEDLADAYQRLESAYTKTQQENTNTEDGEAAAPIEMSSFEEYTNEFAETGDIADHSKDAIVRDMGIPREFVDAYVEGQKAIMESHFNTIYSEVGGEEQYNEMINWAAENLDESDQNAFNNAVLRGDQNDMMFAIRSLAARWGGGQEQQSRPLIQGATGAEGASGGFRSIAELTEAMKDPRYTKDPAYRKDIETRLSHSDIF